MMIRSNTSPGLAIAAAILLSGCASDPQATARDHFEKGNQQLAQQKLPEAIIEYRRAIQADPRLGPARLQLAHAYASAGDAGNALKEYARAAELMADDDEAQLKAGNFMLLTGRYAEAQGVAQRLLARKADHVEAQILMANALGGLRDMDGAVAAFEKAVTLDPTRAATYAELGSIQMATGASADAEAAFRKAIELDPKSPSAQLGLANFLWTKGDSTQALTHVRRALELDPQHMVANRAMAMYYMATKKPEAAEPHLKTVAERMKGPDAKYFLAEYYLRLNRRDEAREILTPLVAQDATFVGASVRLARLEAIDGRNAEAHKLLESALAREATNADALVTLGRLQLSEGNTVNAVTTLKKATEANPRLIEAHVALAQTYAARGQVKEAMTSYNEALNLNGARVDARLGLAQLQIENGSPADAVPLLLRVVGEFPDHQQARLLLLHGLMAVGDLPQATRQLAVLLETHSESAQVQTAAGMLATIKNDAAAAKAAYGRALSADPTSYRALAGLLTAEMQAKQFGSAKALIEKQLSQRPNDPNLLLMAAQTYGALGDAFEMERALKKTVEADPHSLQAYAMLGRMYYQQGRLDLARVELEKYVTTAPASVPGNTMLGTILELQGRRDDAKQRYGRALQIDPRAAVAANNLAWLNARTNGNLDVALQLAQTAKAQLPNRHEVDDTLGYIYYKKGLSSQAIEALSNSTLRQPDNPSYNYHLALAYHQSGNTAEARKHLEKALSSKSNFEGAEDAKKLLESIKG